MIQGTAAILCVQQYRVSENSLAIASKNVYLILYYALHIFSLFLLHHVFAAFVFFDLWLFRHCVGLTMCKQSNIIFENTVKLVIMVCTRVVTGSWNESDQVPALREWNISVDGNEWCGFIRIIYRKVSQVFTLYWEYILSYFTFLFLNLFIICLCISPTDWLSQFTPKLERKANRLWNI